jgi:hypothetical protein
MWTKRVFVVVITVAILASANLSTGSGTARAITGAEIWATARQLAPVVARQWRLVQDEVANLFFKQASKVAPVKDSTELGKLRDRWMTYQPRTPRSHEVVPVRGQVPPPYKKAQKMLCDATVELLLTEEAIGWDYVMNKVKGEISQQYPAGRILALYQELNDIVDKFKRGCYCELTAMLAVKIAQKKFC